MPESTYTPNLGLENPDHLKQVDLWGDTENRGRTIVDNAICGSGLFTLTGTTFAITITPGVNSSAQSRVWNFTGAPSGPCTVTFAPNTAQNVVFVVNSSAVDIIFKQGTGTTATIGANSNGIVSFDGTGAAANVRQFNTAPLHLAGSVTAPSYSFSGAPDVGMFSPGPHSLGIAANNALMAAFTSSGAGPAGLNQLGAAMGPFVGNAFANVDMFAGTWPGPAVAPGYCFLTVNEATKQVFVKYMDSGSVKQVLVVGCYDPATQNEPLWVGAAPSAGAIVNKDCWFIADETKGEIDFYYRNSAGVTSGTIPVFGYGPGNIAQWMGAAPATVNNRNSYFIADDVALTLNWYYKDSAGVLHGPITITPVGPWNNLYVPTCTSPAFVKVTGWTHQCMYQLSSKTIAFQMLLQMQAVNTRPSGDTGTFTISLPVSTYTGANSFAQSVTGYSNNPGVILVNYHNIAFGTSISADYATQNVLSPGQAFYMQFNGTLQTN